MSLTFTIGGTPCSLRSRSLRINETANGRNTFSADIILPTTFIPEIGDEVILEIDAVRFFGGTVNAPSVSGFNPYGGEALVTRVSAIDFNAIADRRIVTETIPAGSLEAALTVLVGYLASYGVTLDVAQVTGPSLTELVYEGRKLSDVLDELSKITGYVWEIDYDKTLRMYAPGAVAAPFNINSAVPGHLIGDVRVDTSETEYANRVIVLAGTGSRNVIQEQQPGDGSTRVFPLDVPVVNFIGVANVSFAGEPPAAGYPVGVYGVDPLIWTFEAATNSLHQDVAQTVIGSGGYVEINYLGQYPVRVQAPDPSSEPTAEQTSRGLIEKQVSEPDIFDVAQAQALADGLLDRYLSSGTHKVRFTTFSEGIHPGQTLTIAVPERDVSGTHLVTDVSIEDTAVPSILRSTVTAIAGTTYAGSWRDFYRNRSGGGTSSASSGGIIVETAGSITGGGTAGTIPKWDTATELTDSLLSETGTAIVVAAEDVNPDINYTTNLGSLSTKYLTLHAAELWVETLVAQNTMATIGGRVLVAPTNILTADLGTGGTTLTVKYNNLASGDRVYLEADSKVEWMAVTSGAGGSAGAYTYTVTRNLDGSGANQWYAGDAVLNTGTTGDGFIDLYSTAGVLSGSGPTIVGNVRTGTTYNNIATRWAIGNLNGIYGYGVDIYGAGFGDASAAHILIDPVFGINIKHGSTVKIGLSPSGDATFDGTITADDGDIGGFLITATHLQDAANVVYMLSSAESGTLGGFLTVSGSDQVGMIAKLSGASSSDIGLFVGGVLTSRASAPFRVAYDGSFVATSATITGSVTATSGAIGGWVIGSDSLTASSGTVGMSSAVTGGDDIRFWAGHATPGSAPFRVTESGALIANTLDANGGTLAALTVDGTLTIGGGGSIVASGITLDSTGLHAASGEPVDFGNGSIIYTNFAGQFDFFADTAAIFTVNGNPNLEVTSSNVGLLAEVRAPALGSDTGTTLVSNGSNFIKEDSSSERFKENIREERPADTLVSALCALSPIRFDYIGGTKDVLGFSAEDVAAVAPELVNTDAEGRPKSIRQAAVMAYMLTAIRAQQAEIAALKLARQGE